MVSVGGGYDDGDDYSDEKFGIFETDGVKPLRAGSCFYMDHGGCAVAVSPPCVVLS